MRWSLVVVAMVGLAGCSGDRILDDPGSPPIPAVDPVVPTQQVVGQMMVSTIPEASTAIGEIGNCFFVGIDTSEMQFIEGGNLTLTWTPESLLASELTATIGDVSASGPSPLTLGWGSEGPRQMPFLVQVSAQGAVQQEAAFVVKVATEMTGLEVVPSSC